MNSYLSRVKESLREESLDFVLFTDPIEIQYLTTISSSNIALLVLADSIHIYTDFRYREVVESYTKNCDILFTLVKGDILKWVSKDIKGNRRGAIQSDRLSVDSYKSLQNLLPDVEFLHRGEELSQMFQIKDTFGIESISQAASIADRALANLIPTLKINQTEREVAIRLNRFCEDMGSEAPSFDTIVLFGEHSALPHGVPSSRMLKRGDTILIDFGCTVNGYCSDMTRTIFVEGVDNHLKELYSITLEAQKLGVKSVVAGVKASQIDRITRDYIEKAGYGELFGHGTGHGVGLRIHESPSISKRDETLLQAGMVITVEPGIYTPNLGGIRVEDLILVTDDGCQTLSKSPKELQIIKL